MKNSNKEILKYTGRIVLFAVSGFIIHVLLRVYLGVDLFAHRIVAAYILNMLVATAILIVILKAPNKYQNSLGFLFLLGSGIKFALFFIGFYPEYKADGNIQSSEFFSFFVPYALCLIAETSALINKLNKS